MTAREARAAQRRRRAAVGEPRTSDFRVKVTAAERADLERVAAARRVTVARLLIDSTLTPERLGWTRRASRRRWSCAARGATWGASGRTSTS